MEAEALATKAIQRWTILKKRNYTNYKTTYQTYKFSLISAYGQTKLSNKEDVPNEESKVTICQPLFNQGYILFL